MCFYVKITQNCNLTKMLFFVIIKDDFKFVLYDNEYEIFSVVGVFEIIYVRLQNFDKVVLYNLHWKEWREFYTLGKKIQQCKFVQHTFDVFNVRNHNEDFKH